MTYMRLREELARAYSAKTWRSDEIDRLADDIAAVEAEIARQPGLFQASDLAPLTRRSASAATIRVAQQETK